MRYDGRSRAASSSALMPTLASISPRNSSSDAALSFVSSAASSAVGVPGRIGAARDIDDADAVPSAVRDHPFDAALNVFVTNACCAPGFNQHYTRFGSDAAIQPI